MFLRREACAAHPVQTPSSSLLTGSPAGPVSCCLPPATTFGLFQKYPKFTPLRLPPNNQVLQSLPVASCPLRPVWSLPTPPEPLFPGPGTSISPSGESWLDSIHASGCQCLRPWKEWALGFWRWRGQTGLLVLYELWNLLGNLAGQRS